MPPIPRARLVLCLILLAYSLPALSAAPLREKVFTDREKERILLPCRNVTEDRRIRCEVRELKRAQAEWGKASPADAYAVYDWLDLGGNHLRSRLKQERIARFNAHWSKTRRTYSALEPTEDINTQRLPYVNRVRETRLNCMYARHGRTRAKCFDRQIDVAQRMMRTPPR